MTAAHFSTDREQRPAQGPHAARSNEATILYVTGSLDIGGAERHLATIAPRLKTLGWQPKVYCLTARGEQADQVRDSGVEVIGPPVPFSRGRNRLFKAFALTLSCLKLFGLLLWRRPTIVHFFLPMAYVIGAPLAILADIPIRIMSRRSLNLYQSNYPHLRKVELRLHRHMSAVLGNSRAVVKQLIEEGCEPARTILIYNGIAVPNAAVDSGSRKSDDDNAMILIIVANLIPYKAHVVLFDALAQIALQLPPSWTLRCVGRDDGIGRTLMDIARRLNLDRHITLLGERPNVWPLLKAADIGILCSHEEGFSNAILEGMAAGLPMIVTDVGGNREAVVDGTTGLIVPAKNPAALGAAILRLASDADLRHRMGDAGRQRVETLFSLERCTECYDTLYRALRDGKMPVDAILPCENHPTPPQAGS